MKRAINCVKFGLSHLLVGVAPGGLHHKLTGECHSSKSVRACTERGQSYHGQFVSGHRR